jgi:tyrosyl-tRNA synthetase
MITTNEFITRGVTFCTDSQGLKKKLESGKTLRVKFWIDPTAPIVHLGHADILSYLLFEIRLHK